jgi:predicted RNA-binding protein with PUA-like domain
MPRRARKYWLLKSEPGTYSIDDLERDGTTCWEGVRNYQARNLLRDEVKKGDLVLFHHSSAKPPGVAGVARVVRDGYPDAFAFDPASPYHDPKSDPADPRWFLVDVKFVERFPEVVPLADLKADPELDGMLVTKRGQRLSVQPVEKAHFERVRKLGRKKRR